ncbi:MAG: mechanosensitive ion channel family protein [Treponemataceae bacterium]|nr:mechanosensitive ion channel family protein [Treponemataceae bacterium]
MEGQTDALHEAADAASTVATETLGKLSAQFIGFFKKIVTWENLFKVVISVVIFFIIWIVFRLLSRLFKKVSSDKLLPQHSMILQKALKYVFYVIAAMCVMALFGIKLSVIWGAAGIAGVAIGFAAQTSVSNFISGLFVVGEKSMKIGDYITVGGESGTVDYVGFLSVKIHTPDNQLVRIPNSSIINSNFKNNNFYPTRRMTIAVSIGYTSDMRAAIAALEAVPALCPTVLAEPAPSVWYDGFGESGINMTLAVWYAPSDLVQTKNDVIIGIKRMLDDARIEIPFNKVDVKVVSSSC